jgi:modulator of FtsH protease HflK
MERNIQKTGVVNWVILLLVGVVSAVVARYSASAAGTVGEIFLGVGFLVALVSYFQMRLEEREQLEKLEFDELKKARSSATLFQEAEADTFPARRAREQFEKFLVPLFTALLFLLQGGGVWWLWKWLDTAAPPRPERAPVAMALYALFFLILFLLGKYTASLARLDGHRLLRPSAGYMMLASLVCLIVAAAEAATFFGVPKTDYYVARGFCVVLGLAAVETLVALVFELYRPRVKGQAARLLYESRLVGLFGQTGGLITTAAQALDYQFGFKVSETWFYKFLAERISLLILLQIAALWFSSTFVIIEPSEQGLLERFGRPTGAGAVLDAGLHFKWPWPIERVYRYRAREVQSFIVGEDQDQDETVLWTRPHFKGRDAEEFNMLVASRGQDSRSETNANEKPVPANLLTVSIPVQYQITNLLAWAYTHADSARLLEELANREVVAYMVSVDMDHIMSGGRLGAAEDIRQRIQDRANQSGLGVNILFVGLQDIHPPIGDRRMPVATAFEAVVGAQQDKQTNILYALAYKAEKIPAARAEATNILAQARNNSLTRVAVAAAEADQFANRVAAFRASPSVYTERSYLETLTRSMDPVRKYFLGATNTQNVLTLNLEQNIAGDLLRNAILPPDATAPPEKK